MKVDVQLYQDEDGVWIAEVPQIPGCGSEGKTRDEALENVQDAIKLCLESRKANGLPLVVETVSIDISAA